MIEFNKAYEGSVRLNSINFDGLAQMFEGNKQEYDPADAESDKMYIGKIGKYIEDSYFWNTFWRFATVQIEFANGYTMVVDVDDIECTEMGMTDEYFLPTIKPVTVTDTSGYKPLTDAEKEFADKVMLTMVSARNELSDFELQVLLDQAVTIAIYRTDVYSRRWDQKVEIKGEDE